jgi:glycosyltransferase involved in cell wall biosynthesis
MRVLVVTNLMPDAWAPQRGRWVFDQIDEIRRAGVEVDLFGFPPGRNEYVPATRRLRRLLREESFDLVHAHYGLAGWCAKLAGAAPLMVTFHGTDVRHHVVGPMSRRLAWRADLVAAVSRALFSPEQGRPGLPAVPGSAVIPCGPDLDRFHPIPRERARAELGLDPAGRYALFPANPARPEKRADRAEELAGAAGADLLTGGAIEPDRMPLWINAANAVIVTSDNEGFGMTCVETLACDVPVLSTRVGIAPFALEGIAGTLCAPFEIGAWLERLAPHLDADDPRVDGAARAASLSAERMAERTIVAYHALIGDDRLEP